MATPGAAAATAGEPREQDKAGKSPQIIIVDLDEAQPAKLVKRLRKGKGKLMRKVERIVGDLVAQGTVKATAQPVVIVVRESPPSFWDFAGDDDDED
jgi:hypothetical protein